MKYCFFIAVFLLLNSYLTFGEEKTFKCLKLNLNKLTEDAEVKNTYSFDSSIDHPRIHQKKMMKFFKSIDKIIGKHLEVPHSQKFFIVPESDGAHFIKEENRLNLPLEVIVTKGSLDEVSHQAMLAHEYGHSIFHHNLGFADPDYLKNIEIIKKSENPNSKLNKKIVFQIKSAKLDNLFIGAYHELFADLVSIIKMKDADAMKKLIGKTTEGKSGEHRSFKSKLKPKGWDFKTPHYVFAPVRSYIGQHLIGRTGDKGKLIKDIFDAVVIEIQKTRDNLVKQYKADPSIEIHRYKLDVEQWNNDLIARLKNI